jgi:hypothetical protein
MPGMSAGALLLAAFALAQALPTLPNRTAGAIAEYWFTEGQFNGSATVVKNRGNSSFLGDLILNTSRTSWDAARQGLTVVGTGGIAALSALSTGDMTSRSTLSVELNVEVSSSGDDALLAFADPGAIGSLNSPTNCSEAAFKAGATAPGYGRNTSGACLRFTGSGSPNFDFVLINPTAATSAFRVTTPIAQWLSSYKLMLAPTSLSRAASFTVGTPARARARAGPTTVLSGAQARHLRSSAQLHRDGGELGRHKQHSCGPEHHRERERRWRGAGLHQRLPHRADGLQQRPDHGHHYVERHVRRSAPLPLRVPRAFDHRGCRNGTLYYSTTSNSSGWVAVSCCSPYRAFAIKADDGGGDGGRSPLCHRQHCRAPRASSPSSPIASSWAPT